MNNRIVSSGHFGNENIFSLSLSLLITNLISISKFERHRFGRGSAKGNWNLIIIIIMIFFVNFLGESSSCTQFSSFSPANLCFRSAKKSASSSTRSSHAHQTEKLRHGCYGGRWTWAIASRMGTSENVSGADLLFKVSNFYYYYY